MANVVVELVSFGQAKEYQEVTPAEAKEILARPMAKGHRWHVPLWQFEDEAGGAAAITMEARRDEAMRQIEEA